jgi:hypothetical protein
MLKLRQVSYLQYIVGTYLHSFIVYIVFIQDVYKVFHLVDSSKTATTLYIGKQNVFLTVLLKSNIKY